MISVVLYGRNGNYGYDLHKRAALSLNCMAELLTDPSDEILFVDYNTPDDFPTFPEAIQDTLTERARDLLRVLRVRPRIHNRFKSKTPLTVLESVARNVAIRRSSPSSRWILSTNADMIPIPLRGRSMTDVVHGLPAGIYRAPRIEIAQAVWESFDRRAAGDIIHSVRQWGGTLRPTQIAAAAEDLQLILRNDLFENHGLDEEMLLKHHVGANIATRMCLKYGAVGDLGGEVLSYHCDHTRRVISAPNHEMAKNDWRRFVDEIDRADIPAQAQTWGCAGEIVEELRLSLNSIGSYVQALRKAIGEPLAEPKIVDSTARTYNKGDYDPRHLMPFLVDMFVSMPRRSNVAWYGGRLETLRLFAIVWETLRFTGNILVSQSADAARSLTSIVRCVPAPKALAEADTFVFDFGGLPVEPQDMGTHKDPGCELPRSFFRVVREEQVRLASGLPLRRIIALNAINNVYEPFVQSFVAAAISPYATHMRHGFVLPPGPSKQDWLPLLSIGEAGIRSGREIKTDAQKIGIIAYGPHKYLDEGTYHLSMEIRLLADDFGRLEDTPCIIVEVSSAAERLGVFCIRHGDFEDANHGFFFDVSQSVAAQFNGVGVRVRTVWPADIVIRSLTVEQTSDTVAPNLVPAVCRLLDWSPYLNLGPNAHMAEGGISVGEGSPGIVVYGPYWTLPAGHYELIASLAPRSSRRDGKSVIVADIVAESSRRVFAKSTWRLGQRRWTKRQSLTQFCLPFELTTDLSAESRTIETRLWTSGDAGFRIHALTVKINSDRPNTTIRPDQPKRRWLVYLSALRDIACEAAGKMIFRMRKPLSRLT